MASQTSLILKTMHVLFWIIFIGLCIKTGTLLFSYAFSMAVNPTAAQGLNTGINLSDLYNYDKVAYSIIVLMLTILTGLKAYIGYLVIKIFLEMKMEKPFSEGVSQIITKIAGISLVTGLGAVIAQAYADTLSSKNIPVPIDWAYGEILFFAGVIYIIAQIFSKGMALQSENELTV